MGSGEIKEEESVKSSAKRLNLQRQDSVGIERMPTVMTFVIEENRAIDDLA